MIETVNDAFDAALVAVQELESQGIRVSVEKDEPSRSAVRKYGNRQGHVAPEFWRHVHFYPVNQEQSRLIHEAARGLGWQGITFDTGGCQGQRDWELDWSFRWNGVPNSEQEMARDQMEDLIERMEL